MDAQTRLTQHLQQSGLADVAKAWIRASCARDLLSSGDAKLVRAKPHRHEDDLRCDRIVAEHLKARQLRYTESVLAAEVPSALVRGADGAGLRDTLLAARVGSPPTAQADGEDSTLLLLLRAWQSFASPHEHHHHEVAQGQRGASARLEGGGDGGSPARASARLDRKLAAVEERHSHLAETLAGGPGLHGPALSARLAQAREEGVTLGGAGLASALAAARAEEAARVQAEERARFDALLEQCHAEVRAAAATSLSTLSAGVAREEGSLVRARNEAEAAAASLRERLVTDMDGAAMREAHARRSSALDSRALTLERERHEDEERRLLSRVHVAEEAARHADTRARAEAERGRVEWHAGVASREIAVARGEAALAAARASLDVTAQAHASALARMPSVTLECDAARAEGERLRGLLAAAHRQVEDGAAEGARARAVCAEAAGKVAALEGKLGVAEEGAAAARAEAAAALAASKSSREDWTAAVRTLRDRLAAAAAKVRAQQDALERQEREGAERLASAVASEHAVLAAKEGAWAMERAGLTREVERAQEECAGETRRADEAAAALAGERCRNSELATTCAELRANARATGAHGAGVARASPAGVHDHGGASSSPSLNSTTTSAAVGVAHTLELAAATSSPLFSLPSGAAAAGLGPGSAFAASQVALARLAEVLGPTAAPALHLSFTSAGSGRQGVGGAPSASAPHSAHTTPGRPPLPMAPQE